MKFNTSQVNTLKSDNIHIKCMDAIGEATSQTDVNSYSHQWLNMLLIENLSKTKEN